MYRYTYVLNNPLKYTDPSGYKFLKIDPEEEAMYYQMQIIIDDWTFRNSNHGLPENAMKRKGGGGGSSGSGGSYHSHISALGGSYSDRFVTYTRPDGSTVTAEIGVDVIGIDPESSGFFDFFSDLKDVINDDDFSLSFEFGYAQLWIVGTTQYNQKSTFAGLNSSNFLSYHEVSIVATRAGGNSQPTLADDVAAGTGLVTSMVSEAARGINSPVVKIVGKGAGAFGGITGTVDNTVQAVDAFSRGAILEGSLQTTQAAGYVTGTVMLFTPLAPIGASILLVNSAIDIAEYLIKFW